MQRGLDIFFLIFFKFFIYRLTFFRLLRELLLARLKCQATARYKLVSVNEAPPPVHNNRDVLHLHWAVVGNQSFLWASLFLTLPDGSVFILLIVSSVRGGRHVQCHFNTFMFE